MINRGAIILKYKKPAAKWVNEVDPNPSDEITLARMNEENAIYLISDDDADGEQNVSRWIKANYQTLFEAQLEDWYRDESLWPENRTFSLFNQWFNVEGHSVILDTVGTEIIDDGL